MTPWWRRGVTASDELIDATQEIMRPQVEAFASGRGDPHMIVSDKCWELARVFESLWGDVLPDDPEERARAIWHAIEGCPIWYAGL